MSCGVRNLEKRLNPCLVGYFPRWREGSCRGQLLAFGNNSSPQRESSVLWPLVFPCLLFLVFVAKAFWMSPSPCPTPSLFFCFPHLCRARAVVKAGRAGSSCCWEAPALGFCCSDPMKSKTIPKGTLVPFEDLLMYFFKPTHWAVKVTCNVTKKWVIMFHFAHIREQMAGEPVHVQWCVWWERGPWWGQPAAGLGADSSSRPLRPRPGWKGMRPWGSI